jgi:hypothetical protein
MNKLDDSRSLTRFGWVAISRGNTLTGLFATGISPSNYLFLHQFMDVAESQAHRNSLPFDPFNSSILITYA